MIVKDKRAMSTQDTSADFEADRKMILNNGVERNFLFVDNYLRSFNSQAFGIYFDMANRMLGLMLEGEMGGWCPMTEQQRMELARYMAKAHLSRTYFAYDRED